MTVFPGYSGQKFIGETMNKVRAVYDAAKAIGRTVDIQVDGGINSETAVVCGRHGANVFVAGNYVFKSSDYAARIRSVRDGAQAGRDELLCGI
jgi:ribulose-phosphate 3-epimerase